jgi:hypothetical protein
MTPRQRLAALLLGMVAALAVAACGGGSNTASTGDDAVSLVRDAFTNAHGIEKGRLAVALNVDAAPETVAVRFGGPFESQGEGRLPKFKLDLAVDEAGGDSARAGATSTGDRGFIRVDGEDYELSRRLFDQFKAGYEQAQLQGKGKGKGGMGALGLDPTAWLKDARKAGEAQVAGVTTQHVTGGVDVARLLDDLDGALGAANALGGQGVPGLPRPLGDEDKREIIRSVKSAKADVFSGKDDRILRRLAVTLGLEGTRDGKPVTGSLAFTLNLSELGESQDIAAPAQAKPLTGLDALAGLLGGGGGAGAGRERLERFSDCIVRAGADEAAARRCAEQLTP